MSRHTNAIALIAALALAASVAHAQTAQEIVSAADKVRNADQSSRSMLRLTEYIGGRENTHSGMVLFSKQDSAGGFPNPLAERDPPPHARERGGPHGAPFW